MALQTAKFDQFWEEFFSYEVRFSFVEFWPRLFRATVLAALVVTLAGCATPSDRDAILNQLDPAPMTPRAWSQVAGSYSGPVRLTTMHGASEGEKTTEIRLDLSGGTNGPGVFLRMDTGLSTAWMPYGERKGTYTNIPSKRYGTQGTVFASTHAPDQLLLRLRRNGVSTFTGGSMILTFGRDGVVNVDMFGHSGWRGDGELWRVPATLTPR